jgi:hypothetical protein
VELVAPDRSLVGHFESLEDSRCPIKRRHILHEMIVIAIAAILCGADGWVAIAQFGRSKRTWFEGFLKLPHGIPSHDTFGRVFGLLEPAAFEACFRAWVASIRALLPGEIIAIDGKTLRRSHNRGAGLAALHMVSNTGDRPPFPAYVIGDNAGVTKGEKGNKGARLELFATHWPACSRTSGTPKARRGRSLSGA